MIAWDAGYWGRKTEDRCYRVAFDGFHSPQMIMRGENPGPYRWNESGLQITNRYHPDGDIVLIGNGPKARAIGADGWTAAKSRELRAKFPKRRVLYRPKRNIIERGVISHGVEADTLEKWKTSPVRDQEGQLVLRLKWQVLAEVRKYIAEVADSADTTRLIPFVY